MNKNKSMHLKMALTLFLTVLSGLILSADSRAMQNTDQQTPDLVILYSSDTRANVECKG